MACNLKLQACRAYAGPLKPACTGEEKRQVKRQYGDSSSTGCQLDEIGIKIRLWKDIRVLVSRAIWKGSLVLNKTISHVIWLSNQAAVPLTPSDPSHTASLMYPSTALLIPENQRSYLMWNAVNVDRSKLLGATSEVPSMLQCIV